MKKKHWIMIAVDIVYSTAVVLEESGILNTLPVSEKAKAWMKPIIAIVVLLYNGMVLTPKDKASKIKADKDAEKYHL